MKKNSFLFILLLLISSCKLFAAPVDTILSQSSPDKQLIFQLRLHNQSAVEYRVVYHQKEIINWSSVGFITNIQTIPNGTVYIKNTERISVNETFPWLNGENAFIHNQYHQLTIHFRQQNGLLFTITARVFNDNIAFRYAVPLQNEFSSFMIFKENTSFRLNNPYTAYRHNTESVISPTPVNELKNSSDFPLVITASGMNICINEAANTNYTKAMIGKGDEENSLAIKFGRDTVKVKGAFQSPWRTISFSETAIGLCNNSDLLFKLNDKPNTSKDYSWIKPGKLLRDMTLSTQGALDCIDFAAAMHFQYIMFDAGWYGKGYAAEFDKESDPVKVVPAIDMPRVISHGKEKGIGLILYVNYVGLRKNNLDTIFTLYKGWGVKGLKFGFVNGLTQDGIAWLMHAVKKAQDYGFIVDVHDNYKPTGISRTIPALLTQEGVRGNENNPDAFHNTTLPFTRFLSGPADYTFCYRSQNDSFNNQLLSKKLQVSQAQQLALTVIFFSPLQSMLWYGRPAYYQKPQEIEFFKYVPTVWDRTIRLEGEIGKYITVARKKTDQWFIGSAANDQLHESKIKLDFLDKNKNYEAVIYADDGTGGISKTKKEVNRNSVLTISVAAKGGEAIIISPR